MTPDDIPGVHVMTLRDYFAAAAPQNPPPMYSADDRYFETMAISRAQWAYAYADAMLKERAK